MTRKIFCDWKDENDSKICDTEITRGHDLTATITWHQQKINFRIGDKSTFEKHYCEAHSKIIWNMIYG